MSRFALALTFGFLFSGCSVVGGGADADCGFGSVASGTLTATAGSESFQAVCIQGQFTSGTLAMGGNLGATEGGSQKQINITVPGAQVGQTYSIGTIGTAIIASYSELDISNPTDTSRLFTAAPGAGSGSLTLDAVSASGASGTFSFTGRTNSGQTLTVSNGRFEIDF